MVAHTPKEPLKKGLADPQAGRVRRRGKGECDSRLWQRRRRFLQSLQPTPSVQNMSQLLLRCFVVRGHSSGRRKKQLFLCTLLSRPAQQLGWLLANMSLLEVLEKL